MKNFLSLLMSVLIISLIQSCSSCELSPKASYSTLAKTNDSSVVHAAPEIPINPDVAFFPLRMNEQGKIMPSYQWRECVRRFVICTKWQLKTVYFEDLSWFYANDYGVTKRKK